jgi:hypothetical protein
MSIIRFKKKPFSGMLCNEDHISKVVSYVGRSSTVITDIMYKRFISAVQ